MCRPITLGSIGFCIALVALGCSSEVTPAPQPPSAAAQPEESMTLYSLDGRDVEASEKTQADEEFHGYPVLGRVTIDDPQTRMAILDALVVGMTESDGKMAKCFWPRHGLRHTQDDSSVDYVICFECYQLQIHSGDSTETESITSAPETEFDKHLQEAGIELAPK